MSTRSPVKSRPALNIHFARGRAAHLDAQTRGPRRLRARPAIPSIRSSRQVRIAICYLCGTNVIKAPILGVPMPVARSYPGVVGNRPLLLVV